MQILIGVRGIFDERETRYVIVCVVQRALAMSVNIDDDVLDVISCVALFYEKGKSGNSFLRTTLTEGEDIKVRQGNS